MSHRERQTCAPESVTPRKMGFGIQWGQAHWYLAPALLPGRLFQHVSCLDKPFCACARLPQPSPAHQPEGLPADVPGAAGRAAFSMEVVSASPCCRKPKRLKSHVQGPRGAWRKAGWFHGQKERPRACRRQDKSRDRPAGWQVDPTNRAPTPKHSLSAPSFAGER